MFVMRYKADQCGNRSMEDFMRIASAEGLPIGTQLVAAYGREDVLIRIAAQLETARPWRERRPPVHAAG